MAWRVFEYTADELGQRFKPEERLNISAVMELPTRFMEEGIGGEIAGIGWLIRIELKGTDYQLHYSMDPDIPRLTNAAIYKLASDLHMVNRSGNCAAPGARLIHRPPIKALRSKSQKARKLAGFSLMRRVGPSTCFRVMLRRPRMKFLRFPAQFPLTV